MLLEHLENYSQLDKEGLAVMFGMKNSHQYVYGRHCTISTDHKPLFSLMNEKRPFHVLLHLSAKSLAMGSHTLSVQLYQDISTRLY